jgi:3-deoxy-D-manno-octulosonic-acid transferase
VARFLDRARPQIAIIMETELWPNLFHACRRRRIPICVANVRMSEASMRGYLKFPNLTRATLEQVSLLAVQSDTDAQRLRRMGASGPAVQVTGSIKFEINLPASLRELAEVLRGQWGRERPVWIAASTHAGEDEIVLAAHRALKARFPALLLVLVPRHPERFAAVARLCRREGYNTALRTETAGGIAADVDVLVGDTMGELQLLFGACDVAFIGGSLVPTGGHNILEASALGIPVVFGPHMFNFQEIGALALERGAARQVRDGDELARVIGDYLTDANARFEAGEAGRKMVAENRGALEKTLALLGGLIEVHTAASRHARP